MMSMGMKIFVGAAVVILLTAVEGLAQISVDKAIVSFAKGKGDILNATVQNGGTDAVWIEGVVDAIERPGYSDEQRVPTEDLIISPKRFSIEGGGQRTVRLLLKKPLGDTEQVYRIKFMPQTREFDTEELKKGGGRTTQLKVIFTVGMLVFGEPLEPRPDLKWERFPDRVVFRNDGNVNILFDDIQVCKAENSGCRKVPGNRLYPGNVWETEAASGEVLQLRKQVGSSFEDLIIPAQ